ncbi:hypothetical protein SLEP1_g8458 [Rubroshorea leprosula]|uniref:Uncharacterized protein n=1 Tax=Rubroshorea leprosula TaxID=152421 RepID=A0AAV5ICP6_9ROSI|nr:hypothetical protein SLEP1_g8458 [Rubroshorea leprosula]
MMSPEPDNTPMKHLMIGFVVSFMGLCSKQAKRVSKKLKTMPSDITGSPRFHFHLPPNSPLRTVKPKKLLSSISNKAITFVHRKKKVGDGGDDEFEEEFGDGGVWQRAILMGDRCQPLNFSGVIYYDCNGKRLDELPVRSPRASPLPGYLTQRQARKAELSD